MSEVQLRRYWRLRRFAQILALVYIVLGFLILGFAERALNFAYLLYWIGAVPVGALLIVVILRYEKFGRDNG